MMKKKILPYVGLIVGYVMNSPKAANQIRPAIITRVWDAEPTVESMVQLQVFTDGLNDMSQNVEWRTSVHQDAGDVPALGTWHELNGSHQAGLEELPDEDLIPLLDRLTSLAEKVKLGRAQTQPPPVSTGQKS